jgi:hypothetical protein
MLFEMKNEFEEDIKSYQKLHPEKNLIKIN